MKENKNLWSHRKQDYIDPHMKEEQKTEMYMSNTSQFERKVKWVEFFSTTEIK